MLEHDEINYEKLADSKIKRMSIIAFLGSAVVILVLIMGVFAVLKTAENKKTSDPRNMYSNRGTEYFEEEYISENKLKDINEIDNPNIKAPTVLKSLEDGIYDELSHYFCNINELIDNDRENLYYYVDSKNLEKAGYLYSYQSFDSYIDNIVKYVGGDNSTRHMFITDCSKLSDCYICTVVIINEKNGTENNLLYDYDRSIEQEMTVYIGKDNKATFLPFNILDISICSDIYGLTKIS